MAHCSMPHAIAHRTVGPKYVTVTYRGTVLLMLEIILILEVIYLNSYLPYALLHV